MFNLALDCRVALAMSQRRSALALDDYASDDDSEEWDSDGDD